ncbi:ABC transporter substrate-binding protein [Chitinasiproducens palmae]|uniref:NitT/TauT family transport system substrate-binding protein n=1 Tax=Chitinasiproducens palmae TaxID=1770053 RepID=A0A1H2PT40_9BURK|nr:ABC transporter substrate-binding protein [Chitinasiproducens palmae]SDV50263.1 NitT/TauT family transport system substrate-binding protein [Chitinasiproducens palmae]
MKNSVSSDSPTVLSVRRRQLLKGATAAAGSLALPAYVRAQSSPKIRIGYWPVASGLPFYAAVEKGYFKEAGLDVEAQKHASAQQAMEAMLSGRAEGSANGVATAVLAVGEIAQPGLMKIFCSNPTNARYVLDEFIVAKDSTLKSVADLKGMRIACGPGVQNVTIAKTILERAGLGRMSVRELPIAQHVAAIAAGQVDAVYTLEPTGTVGRLNGATRVLEAGVVAKYILGDPMAPWFGGSATLTSEFIKAHPDAARKFIAAYRRGVELVKKTPAQARPYLKGYTAIEGALTAEVPMSDYVYYDEFKPRDIAYFQQYFDLFTEKGIFAKKLSVESMLYKG